MVIFKMDNIQDSKNNIELMGRFTFLNFPIAFLNGRFPGYTI